MDFRGYSAKESISSNAHFILRIPHRWANLRCKVGLSALVSKPTFLIMFGAPIFSILSLLAKFLYTTLSAWRFLYFKYDFIPHISKGFAYLKVSFLKCCAWCLFWCDFLFSGILFFFAILDYSHKELPHYFFLFPHFDIDLLHMVECF